MLEALRNASVGGRSTPLRRRAYFTAHCSNAPWYLAPVIVGGSGGSGTRGVAMLLEELGVRMACIGQPSLTDPAVCKLPCNAAADCGVINSFLGEGLDRLAWCRSNFTRASAPCDDVERAALRGAANLSSPALARCGGSKADALQHILRKAVRPQFRRPRRWGFKNPHSTYYVNILRAKYFPVRAAPASAPAPPSRTQSSGGVVSVPRQCLVYINTVRDLDEMLRTAKHFGPRVKEARRFGVLDEATSVRLGAIGEAVGRRHRSDALDEPDLLAMQTFYGHFVKSVNLGLEAWAGRCLPGRTVHVPLQRMVALAPRAPGCARHVALQLAAALSLDAAEVVNVTRAFAAKSLQIVVASRDQGREQRTRMLVREPSLLSWPTGSALQPTACVGTLDQGVP
jgi:hypothetical protein